MPDSQQNPRLDPHPAQIIDRSRAVVFDYEGKPVQAYEGDTVASALYAAGTRTFGRSFKYHRPRGLLCGAGRCPNCLMTVDGVPNVRSCTEKVRSGMRVRHQNAWPSLDLDFLSLLDNLGRFMPVGFYYKVFHRPKFLWKLVQPIIRRIGGLGVLDMDPGERTHSRHKNLHTQVAIVGGGPAGLSAALAAAGAGARVMLIDEQPSLGGHLRFDTATHRDIDGYDEASGHEIAASLAESVRSSDGVDVLSDAAVFGLYGGNELGITSSDHLIKLRADRVIVATGSYEEPLVFEKNDLPGVMLASTAQRLMRLYGVMPGRNAVVATATDRGYSVALDLLEAGVRVAGVVDSRPEFPHDVQSAETLRSRGILILTSYAVVRAEGRSRVDAVVATRLDNGAHAGEERRIDSDLLCMSGGFQPADALLYQAGCRFNYDQSLSETVPRELPDSVYAVGEVTGIHDLRASILQGELAGKEAATSLDIGEKSKTGTALEKLRRNLVTLEENYRGSLRPAPPPVAAGQSKRRFVCLCEDLTASDIAVAVDEGFDDIQTLKRYSTATMGPCQGKMCLKSFVGISAQLAGKTPDEMGVTTHRPPLQPVLLGTLAGPAHMPIKRTPMDRIHRGLGARIVDLGPWRRPFSYTSPQDECLAVRQRVGIIDVSTLGKLDVRGRDAPALLDKVYTHDFSGLKSGRIRYGMMCADNGTVMDDGTVTRLDDERFFITTTTGNVEAIEEWFKWWMAGTDMCAHVTNMTSALAAINVAGPRARDTLSKLTDVDLSSSAFRYMRSAQGRVAGVPAILLRIGFVGETGWEIHFPAEYGEHVWDAVTEAGTEFGITPFGLEAQRILRLEKGHVIVGQDTDAVTNPMDAGMEWVVRFEKDDFIGRASLLDARGRGLKNRLVGFVMSDGKVPDDGDPVVKGREPIGRVTSARFSPTLGKGFGLAWVPVGLANEGTEIHIRVDGKDLAAVVTLKPVYDAVGARLRE